MALSFPNEDIQGERMGNPRSKKIVASSMTGYYSEEKETKEGVVSL